MESITIVRRGEAGADQSPPFKDYAAARRQLDEWEQNPLEAGKTGGEKVSRGTPRRMNGHSAKKTAKRK